MLFRQLLYQLSYLTTGPACEGGKLVLLGRIELPTSSLPMKCSTTELQQHAEAGVTERSRRRQRPFCPMPSKQAPQPLYISRKGPIFSRNATLLKGGTIMRSVFIAAILAVLAIATPAMAQSNGEAALQGWDWWKNLSEAARTQLAPKLVELGGQAGATASLTATAASNTAQYRALCNRSSGAFRTTEMCQALQYTFGERSPLSRVLEALSSRTGTETAPARDAAAILAGLRQELKVGNPARPQYLLSGFYQNFGQCSPPACQPGLSQPTLKGWLTAAAGFVAANGNNEERTAAEKLQQLGWR